MTAKAEALAHGEADLRVRAALREHLIRAHRASDPEPGYYSQYGLRLMQIYQAVLVDLNLVGYWIIPESEDGWVCDLTIGCPDGRRVPIPDIGNWDDGDGTEPTHADEVIEFWFDFAAQERRGHA